MEKHFYIFRHGESSYNICHRVQGQSDRSRLTSHGRFQAAQAGKKLAKKGIEIIISSPLKRARETGEIIAGIINVPMTSDKRFIEVDLGEAEGLYYDELPKRYGELYEEWRKSSSGNKNVRFPGGESKAEVRQRIFEGLNYYAENTPYHNFGISSHGIMLIQILLAFGIRQYDIPNCSIICLKNMNHNWHYLGFI